MSEHATLEPSAEKSHQPQTNNGADPAAGQNVPTPLEPPLQSAMPPNPSVPGPRRGNPWLVVPCALVALLAAIIALAAPGLRPVVAASADSWFGKGNMVSRLVAPAGSLDMPTMAMQVMNAQLANYSAQLDRLAVAQQAMSSDLGRALVNARTDHTTIETLSRSVDDLSRQIQDLHEITAATDRRVRAAGLLTLAMRLRRDLDAGLPLEGNLAAIDVTGPYPPAIVEALQQLRAHGGGVPTMRDLADELDRVMARLAVQSESEGNWASRSWAHITAIFGEAPAGNAALVRRLHTLAIEGRFTEAASELMASNAADEGMSWAARVRARATAVVATQTLLAYSLAAYENAFATTSVQ